jgi:magnesium transporter
MAAPAPWMDLLDPSEEALRKQAGVALDRETIRQLIAPASPDRAPQPTLQSRGAYVLGVFLIPVAVAEEDRVYYQEVDVVIAPDRVLTVRKTPPGETPFDVAPVQDVCRHPGRDTPAMVAYHIVDEVADRYLQLIDELEDEIDELEEHVDDWPARRTQARLSELRHDLVRIRRTLTPTRDSVGRVVDGRIDVDGAELLTPAVERHFAGAYDKLLHAGDALDLARDLLAAVRDYQQAEVSREQNDVLKKLGVVASLLLFPTFIVGVYGQNFERLPEVEWRFGYLFSWGLIVFSTIAQVAFFKWRKWI